MRCSLRVVSLVVFLLSTEAFISAQVTSSDPDYTVSLFGSGLQLPDGGMIYRPATHDFLVCQEQAGQIARLDAVTGAVTVFASLPAAYQGYSMNHLAINSKGEVFLPLYINPAPVLRFDSQGSFLGSFPLSQFPTGATFDASDNFYVSLGADDNTGNTIYEFPAGNYTTPTLFASGFTTITALAFNASGQLFAADYSLGEVFQVTPGGTTVGSHTVWASGIPQADALAVDPVDQSLFVGEYTHPDVIRVTSPGVSATFATGFNTAEAIGFDPAGNVFVTEKYTGAIWKFTRITPSSGLTVSPNHGGNAGAVTVRITGQGLEDGAKVTLSASGNPIAGTNTTLLNPTTLSTTFDLRTSTPGVYDVLVNNPDGTSLTLSQAFTVGGGGTARISVQIIGLDKIRVDREQTYYLAISNIGDVDSPAGLAVVEVPSSIMARQASGSGLYMAGITSGPDFSVAGFISAAGASGSLLQPLASAPTAPGSQDLVFASSGIPVGGTQISPVYLVVPSNGTVSSFSASAAWQPDIDFMSFDQYVDARHAGLIPFDSSCTQCYALATPQVNALNNAQTAYTAFRTGQTDEHFALANLGVSLGSILVGLGEESAVSSLETAVPGFAGAWAPFKIGASGLLSQLSNDPPLQTYRDMGVSTEVLYLKLQAALPNLQAAGSTAYKSAADTIDKLSTINSLLSNAMDIVDAYNTAQGNRARFFPLFDAYLSARSAYQSCLTNSCQNPPPQPPGPPPNIPVLPITPVNSLDPNTKIGPLGASSSHFMTANAGAAYSIQFENDPSATAPVQQLTVTDQLDPAVFDLTSISLGPVDLAGIISIPAPGAQTWTDAFDQRPAQNLKVRINATVNASTGLLSWTANAIDPNTGLPPADPTIGFLAPGQSGNVSLTVLPKAGLQTGTVIANAAAIKFDTNAPIVTPAWTNMVDVTPPTSHVSALPSAIWTTNFTVSWAGTDVGAGVQDYTINVSVDGGTPTAWQSNISTTSATYSGQVGHTYSFFSTARDLVGNVESSKTTAEATTTVALDTTPPVITPTVSGTLGQNGWYTSTVNVSWSVTDPESGIATSNGCSAVTLSTNIAGMTITCSAANRAGLSNSGSVTIKIDQSAPVIAGMPPTGCELWPPDRKLVRIARVMATDSLSGLASFTLTGMSNEPGDSNDVDDIKIEGRGPQPRMVYLRANQLGHDDEDNWKRSTRHEDDDRDHGHHTPKVYTLTATAADLAGNTTTVTSTCTVKEPSRKDKER